MLGGRRKKTRKRRRKKTKKEKRRRRNKKLVEKKVESNYMSKRRFNHNDKLWIAKEEVKDLERLLKEAEERLNLEYEKVGGRTWLNGYGIYWDIDIININKYLY